MRFSNQELEQAAALLNAGELVAFPTETVYGLGANALSDRAVAHIYEAKGRPSFNPLIVHVPSLEVAARHVKVNEKAERLASEFWPGPLTMVLKRKPDCALSLLVSAGLDSVAVRVPGHHLAQELLKAAGVPIAAPSANRSGRISPTTAAHVEEELGGRVALILDGGPCTVGIESTVIDLTGDIPLLLRPGSITLEQITRLIGPVSTELKDAKQTSPGMMQSHYAPRKKLRLNANDAKHGETLIAFGPPDCQMNLSVTGNPTEAAANLFRMLREADSGEGDAIAVMPIPEEGLGVAINDRLRRAAAPRG